MKKASADVKANGLGNDCVNLAASVCREAASGQLAGDDQPLEDQKYASACVKAQFAGTTAAPAAAVGAEIVRSIAQVVVTKAQAAGWALLIKRLKETAQCADPGGKFPDTCKVLDSLSIKDLVSSPDVLLAAAITDLLRQLKVPVFQGMGASDQENIAALAMADAAAAVAQSGSAGLAGAMKRAIISYIREHAQGACKETFTIPEQYGYVAGMCVIQFGTDAPSLNKCDAASLIDACNPNDDAKPNSGGSGT